jgi:hypothetical protein
MSIFARSDLLSGLVWSWLNCLPVCLTDCLML